MLTKHIGGMIRQKKKKTQGFKCHLKKYEKIEGGWFIYDFYPNLYRGQFNLPIFIFGEKFRS